MLKPFFQKALMEAGCDEAGRGCLAGPVFAAAVILPKGFYHELLNDSKQVNEKNRNELRAIIEKEAIAFAVSKIENTEIDTINILKASFKAMHLAIDKLKVKPGLLLIDGNRFVPYKKTPHKCIIKGDATYTSIAAASILAKTYRDEYMNTLHLEYPQYNWNANKGYGTLTHRRAIEVYGVSPFHRKSFRLLKVQASLFESE
ncbi:MAG TPA: ribonuclease HII [Chitinophagaceae bacterium]|nr:ribonuclease HII [Chitinophagaceae bacterium]HNJ26079.1 ribonuclease HII [Chitinophagaceae bacterium]HNK61833.1 ribonuclease HII [Chitinophagaceae bacterium]